MSDTDTDKSTDTTDDSGKSKTGSTTGLWTAIGIVIALVIIIIIIIAMVLWYGDTKIRPIVKAVNPSGQTNLTSLNLVGTEQYITSPSTSVTQLDYYEEYSGDAPLTNSGGGGTSISALIYIVRVGKLCTLTTGQLLLTTGTTVGPIILTLPSRFTSVSENCYIIGGPLSVSNNVNQLTGSAPMTVIYNNVIEFCYGGTTSNAGFPANQPNSGIQGYTTSFVCV
jgi:hypothetical protein